MARMGRQILGFALAALGFVGTIAACALPMWKVSAFIGSNIVMAQIFWEGLWMNCVAQSTGQMQCKAYDSILALPQDLQAARALVVVSIAVAVVAALLGVAGAHCTTFIRDPASKGRVGVGSGVAFIAAGVLCLIPVCWSASSIITGFYNPLASNAQRGELGAAIYIGWGAGALLVLGGGLICSSCPPS
ncbi:claudin-like protein ZF-A89 [Megalops cyprinoides]|uniref:claudin-like protein ZF-A89 n=1 Tax=Megalops cyprinoides TaxID=118141 RepID=UPI001863F795|nr:claudin-like protein ZF-A89 [Megalops cyprinoides]